MVGYWECARVECVARVEGLARALLSPISPSSSVVADLVLPVLCLDRLVSENGLRLCCSTLAGGKTGTPYPLEQILDVRWTSKVNREGVSRKRVLRTWRENEKEFEKFPELIAKNPSFLLCGVGRGARSKAKTTREWRKKKRVREFTAK